MLQKILNLPVAVYCSVFTAVKTLRDDERGLSGVVVAILLILVAVLAIVLIWGFLGRWLQDLWEEITNQADTIS